VKKKEEDFSLWCYRRHALLSF